MEANGGKGGSLVGESAAFVRFDEEEESRACGLQVLSVPHICGLESRSRLGPSGLAGSGFSAFSLAQAFFRPAGRVGPQQSSSWPRQTSFSALYSISDLYLLSVIR